MQLAGLAFLSSAVLSQASDAELASSPIAQVLTMLSNLEAKIIKEGEVSQKEFNEFTEWCEERSRNLGFEIKTGQASVEDLKATIAEEVANTGALNTKVEELASGIATDEADLKAATEIRSKEAADFAAEEKELMETIDMLHRASSILERQMQGGGAAMVQLKNAGSLVQAFQVMVQASLIGTSDASKLTAFVQSAQKSDDADDDAGAPAAAVYKSQSGGILDVLEDLLEKAEGQLDDSRKKETTAQHNFNMLRQSLEDELKFAAKDMDEAKKAIAASAEAKSTAEGDLQATSKELSADIEVKGSLHHNCMSKAADFQSETLSRGEELKALAQAKKIISEATDGAASFLQVGSQISTKTDLVNFEAVRMVRDLARKQHSNVLAQLAVRMAAAARSSDPFEKVKGLITDMIAKLEQQAGADATKKAYCDKELAESNAKKADKSEKIDTLTTRLDKASAKSAQLKEEVATLENELSALAKSQAEMDKLRQNEKETYGESKAELEKGLAGIKTALQVLRDYYAKDDKAHDAADGASSGIVSLLEVIEADFTKNLAQANSDEDSAVAEYEKITKENELDRTMKSQDVKYKTKESKELDKYSAELTSDRTGEQAELDAVLEYLAKIEDQCIAKAETYETRAARREAELAGLKEALQILESETALVQKHRKGKRALRGKHAHHVLAAALK